MTDRSVSHIIRCDPVCLNRVVLHFFGVAEQSAALPRSAALCRPFPGVPPGEVSLWFGVVYMVNMQMSFLSPPFGYALFYLKSVAPPEITMGIIFRAAVPFLFLQAVGLALVVIFPEIILWLPRLVYGN